MTYAFCAVAGLLIGALAAWLIASAHVTNSLATKVEESTHEGGI